MQKGAFNMETGAIDVFGGAFNMAPDAFNVSPASITIFPASGDVSGPVTRKFRDAFIMFHAFFVTFRDALYEKRGTFAVFSASFSASFGAVSLH